MRPLFKGAFYSFVPYGGAPIIQGRLLIKGAHYLRLYGNSFYNSHMKYICNFLYEGRSVFYTVKKLPHLCYNDVQKGTIFESLPF